MNGLRDQQLHFRVSKQELERIWSKMESSGILSIGSYLRKMALEQSQIENDMNADRILRYGFIVFYAVRNRHPCIDDHEYSKIEMT